MQKFNLDLSDNNKVTRSAKIIFGVLCLVVVGYFAIQLSEADAITRNTITAFIFIALFGIWEILSGFSLTERYIIIDSGSIITKLRFYSPERRITAGSIKMIAFKPLTVTIILNNDKEISLRLGTYYKDNSARLMEAVERFGLENNIEIIGIKPQEE